MSFNFHKMVYLKVVGPARCRIKVTNTGVYAGEMVTRTGRYLLT